MSDTMRGFWGEFFGCGFAACFGLGLLIPFAVLGFIGNMHEFAVWFGLVFIFAIMIFAPMSGAHLNPSVTLAFWLFGDFEGKKVIPYIIAQILGWGAGLIPLWIAFGKQLGNWAAATGGNPATLWFCGGGLGGDILGGGMVEFLMTLFLVVGIFACCDNKVIHKPIPALFPVTVGIIIAIDIALGAGFTGTAINTARDLGPRIFSLFYGLIMGYDVSGIFSGWTWVMYVIAPTLAGPVGGWFYTKVLSKFMAPAPEEAAE